MEGHTDAYIDHMRAIIHGYPSPPYVAIEQRVDYSAYAPEGFGTGDCIFVGAGMLDVVDFKYGQGVPVSAEENAQMKLYGLGALAAYSMLLDIKKIRCTIFQPRLDSISTWETTADELRAWGESIKPKAALAFEGGGPCVPGKWCSDKFCKAQAVCRARGQGYTALEDFGMKQPPLISNAEVGEILKRGQALAEWVKALEEYALKEALRGEEIPGWKVVEGRSNRKFTDTEQVFNVLKAAGYEEALLYKREPISLTAIEELLKKADFNALLSPYIVKGQGKPALVVSSDNRQPLNRPNAQDDFAPNEAPKEAAPDPADQAIETWSKEAAAKQQPAPMVIPEELVDDVRKYYGLPPFNTAANTQKGDGFLGSKIRTNYPVEKIQRVLQLLGVG
jgi:hypothetical protein